MIFGSVCSGIEAASVAWEPLGWRPAFYAEIEKFPSAVLAHHYPETPNLGDIMQHERWSIERSIDILVGGTPCQDFSVAGLRAGLAGDRGELSLEFGRIAARLRPRWIIWENVPGVLSNNGGQDFATILGLFSGKIVSVPAGGWKNFGIVPGYPNAYGLAWRVLDTQFVRVDGFGRAIPQRRRRLFIVGYSGDWRRSTAVLFEPEGLRRDSPPSRQAGEGVAPTIAARTRGGGGLGTDFDCDGGLIPAVANPLTARMHKGINTTMDEGQTMVAFDSKGTEVQLSVDGSAPTLRAMGAANSGANGGGQLAVVIPKDASITTPNSGRAGIGVRRLTPRECERLQGFPEFLDRVRIEVWHSTDLRQKNAPAENINLRSPKSVLIAEGSASPQSVNHAEQISSTNRPGHVLPVVLNVLIDLERGEVQIHKAGRLIWSANTAAKPSASPLLMPLDDFVRLVALMMQIAVPQTINGREELHQNISSSSPALLGSACVGAYGQEIEELASDAGKFSAAVESCMKSITSPCGQNSQNCGSILRTLNSCVTAAISSFIPSEIRMANSYAVTVETVLGYTAIPWRGKAADACPDGPRYKALGNSMSVNVMRWIGKRIEAVDKILGNTP